MINEKELPKRKSIRLKEFDYSKNGTYFVTISTADRKFILWDAEKTKEKLENFNVYNVGANCVRPSNIPLSKIGQLVDNEIQNLKTVYTAVTVEKYCIMSNHIHLIIGILPDKNGRTQFAPTLSRVVKQFKGKVTKNLGFSIWQRSFLDRIIRNQKGYDEVWKYIEDNPYKYFYERKKLQEKLRKE